MPLLYRHFFVLPKTTTTHHTEIALVARFTMDTPSMVALRNDEPFISLFQTDAAGRHVDDYIKVL